uniref:Putative secreted protein n=1 Tax=Panstrongylus lignarius TaxID=156445 RepID=A0A224XSW3_9HEMI
MFLEVHPLKRKALLVFWLIITSGTGTFSINIANKLNINLVLPLKFLQYFFENIQFKLQTSNDSRFFYYSLKSRIRNILI